MAQATAWIQALLGALWRIGVLRAAWKVIFSVRKRFHREWYTFLVSREAASVGPDLLVQGPSHVSSETHLGTNVNFNGLHVRGGGPVDIGDNFHSGPGCRVLTRNHNYDDGDAIPYDATYIVEGVEIGDNVWFGVDVTVLPGVTIGEGAIVQAGSTVVDDVPDGAIVGGHPAEVITYRDMEHYQELKQAGSFH